jgi:hypothetical protein
VAVLRSSSVMTGVRHPIKLRAPGIEWACAVRSMAGVPARAHGWVCHVAALCSSVGKCHGACARPSTLWKMRAAIRSVTGITLGARRQAAVMHPSMSLGGGAPLGTQ